MVFVLISMKRMIFQMKRTAKIISLLLLCLFVLAPVVLAAPAQPDGTITITGTVTGSGGAKLADAIVTVSSAMQIPGGMYHTETGETNSNGYYEIELPYYDYAGDDVDWPHTGYIKVKAEGYYAKELWPTEAWQKNGTHNHNFSMSSASSPVKAWAGLRNSYYGARDPYGTGSWQYEYPSNSDWGAAVNELSDYFGSSTNPTLLLLVGEVKTEAGPGSGTKLWFENPWPGTDWGDLIEFVDPTLYEGLNIHSLLGYCDSNNIKVYLQVESGHASIETLISLVMGAFWWHPSVAGFVVDAEWYNNSVDGNDGTPINNTNAENWERQVKSTWRPDLQLGLKHFDIAYMPDTYRGDIFFINDSQGFDTAADLYGEMSDWADEFAPNDVWFQQGYGDDQDIWSAMTEPIPQTFGNGLYQQGNAGQKVGFLWVDFTMREVIDIFKAGVNPGDTWEEGVWYYPGDTVIYDSQTWECVYTHRSQVDWYPGAPGLWFWAEQ